MIIAVADYQLEWARQFEMSLQDLMKVFGNYAVSIKYVGSTSVMKLPAKPIIDIDIIGTVEKMISMIAALESMGYKHRGNLGIEDREALASHSQSTDLPKGVFNDWHGGVKRI